MMSFHRHRRCRQSLVVLIYVLFIVRQMPSAIAANSNYDNNNSNNNNVVVTTNITPTTAVAATPISSPTASIATATTTASSSLSSPSSSLSSPLSSFSPSSFVSTSTPTALRFTQANVINFTQQPLKDFTAQKRRNIDSIVSHEHHDSTQAASVKSYDPPPEFYRGPTYSTGTSSSSSNRFDGGGSYPATVSALPNAAADFLSKTNTIERSKYGSIDGGHGGGGIILSKQTGWPAYWPGHGGGGNSNSNSNSNNNNIGNIGNGGNSIGGTTAGLAKQGFNDRISVGHYGSPGHTSAHSGGGGGSIYETARPYIESEHIDYGNGGGGHHHHHHYPPLPPPLPPSSGHVHSTAPGYYATSGHGNDGIHFDVYGDGAKGHYAGAGGEYSYTYPPELHEPAAHKGHAELSPKALLAKSFLIPLASAAVLGIAAALVSNPLLLQLGTVSALPPTIVGRRKRRALTANAQQSSGVKLALGTRKHAQTLAYRRTHHNIT